jgi:hypothetical protein
MEEAEGYEIRGRMLIDQRELRAAKRAENRNAAVYRSMLATSDGKPGAILDSDAKD